MIKAFFKAILYRPLFNLLIFLAWLVPGHSIGWAIIILTILVRLALWKPTVASLKAPLQLRAHQDELKAIQERHKDDRTAQAQAQMAFYREKGINPLSGCLTMLIQLPVIYILYRVFLVGLNSLRTDLLYSFTPHLNTINPTFLGINLTKADPHFILPVIAAVLTFFQSRQLQAISPAPGRGADDPMAMASKQMMYTLPIVILLFTYKLPAGLALYWVTTTLFSYFLQVYVARNFAAAPKTVVTVRSKKS